MIPAIILIILLFTLSCICLYRGVADAQAGVDQYKPIGLLVCGAFSAASLVFLLMVTFWPSS